MSTATVGTVCLSSVTADGGPLLRTVIKQTAFLPVRCTGCDDGFGGRACTVTNSTDGPAGHALESSCAAPAACERAAGLYGGFWGPFVYP